MFIAFANKNELIIGAKECCLSHKFLAEKNTKLVARDLEERGRLHVARFVHFQLTFFISVVKE